MIAVSLVERGPSQFIPIGKWRLAGFAEPLQFLASQGVLGLKRTDDGILVTPRSHVGELNLTAASLKVLPKSPDLLKAMDTLAVTVVDKIAKSSEDQMGDDHDDFVDLAAEFAATLSDCVQDGVPWIYSTETKQTSFPRGRIEFSKTVRRLAARGIKHRVFASSPVRMQDETFVKVVRTALERLKGMERINLQALAEAELLSNCLEQFPTYEAADIALEIASSILPAYDATDAIASRKLIMCCIRILSHEVSLGGWIKHFPTGHARFRNTEVLWEKCVYVLVEAFLVKQGFGGEAKLHGLRDQNTYLFGSTGPKIDPDVVVNLNSKVTAVLDAKYKVVGAGSSNSAADLYQLTCYTNCVSAKIGALIHLTEDEEYIHFVGTTGQGASILNVGISDNILIRDRENALSRLADRWPSFAERFH